MMPVEEKKLDIDSDDLLTISEAYELLPVKIHPRTFRRWCEEGKHGLVVKKFGGQLRVLRDSLPKLENY